MQLITVCTFSDITEAYIVKGRLENEGVPCYIADENVNVLRPSLGFTIGSIKLQVEASLAEKALAILNEIQ